MNNLNWRDVSKELPIEKCYCLMCYEHNDITSDDIRGGVFINGNFYEGSSFCKGDYDDIGSVTEYVKYWLPIDEIPLPLTKDK